MASTHAASSMLPMAPSEWPTIDLIELIGVRRACSPRLRLTAAVSCRSFCLVLEPCALTYPTSSAPTPARASAVVMDRAISTPSVVSPVMWYALPKVAKPPTSQ
jgi:hypothetical protein